MTRKNNYIAFVLGWTSALLIFFPIFWMALTSLKTETQAYAFPPVLLFHPTLDNFRAVLSQSTYSRYAWNSISVSVGGTAIAMALSVPAAYSMAFHPSSRTSDILMWMMSTRMMPPVSALIPTYLILARFGLIDSVAALIGIYALMNLPITVWLIYSYFREVPREILEAGRIDGMSVRQEIWSLLLPMSLPGIASSALLSLILCWNEAFWSISLTSVKAGTLTVFIAGFSNPQGLFLAKLSAASVLAIVPILIFGWVAQRHLVRGLTFGAVK